MRRHGGNVNERSQYANIQDTWLLQYEFWKRQNYEECKKKAQWFQELGWRGGWIRRAEKIIKSILYGVTMVDTFVKNIEKHQEWIAGWQWCVDVGSSIVTNSPPWQGMLMIRKVVCMWREGAYGILNSMSLIVELLIFTLAPNPTPNSSFPNLFYLG